MKSIDYLAQRRSTGDELSSSLIALSSLQGAILDRADFRGANVTARQLSQARSQVGARIDAQLPATGRAHGTALAPTTTEQPGAQRDAAGESLDEENPNLEQSDPEDATPPS